MRARLIFFCDKGIETGWLSAVIIIPLFFNIHSERIFEPDKISFLRSIALMMSVVWAVRAVENLRTYQSQTLSGGGIQLMSFWKRLCKTPLVLPSLLLVLVYIISTALSVAPRVSLLGSYKRLQGTYTTLSYIIIFFLIIQGLRSKRQLDRLITGSILVSFPIAMYGIFQHFGLDPLPWGTDVTMRVVSSMGSPIFLAAFLIMVVPLTMSRLLENWKEVASRFDLLDGVMAGVAIVLPVGTLMVGVLIHSSDGAAWMRWLFLLAAVGVQAAVHLLIPAGRLPRVLTISLPITFFFLVGFSWTLEIFLPPASSIYLWLGLVVAFIFMLSMAALAHFLDKPVSRFLLLAGYLVILITQLTCIFYTQSRGPMIGLLGGLFFYFGLLGLLKQRVWISWMISGLAIAMIVSLVIFNTVDVPLVKVLREKPYLGRLGKLLQTERTGKVRTLIWGGVVNMIYWNTPLEYPGDDGGPDPLNALRPFIGYGPESMYLSYNRFYPPELAHYTSRGTFPDRSHNETFDALATTGVLGFLVYMILSTSIFYYGFKWLGLIRNPRQKLTFLGLWVGGGIAGGIVALFWFDPLYIGLGIPGGLILGLIMYVFISMLRFAFNTDTQKAFDSGHSLWMLALVSAMVAHFIEIHIGIAVAATRTYFWTYAAMMVVIGTRLANQPIGTEQNKVETADMTEESKTSTAASLQTLPPLAGESDWMCSFLFLNAAAVLILSTMLFEFSTFQWDNLALMPPVWNLLTQNRVVPSLGIPVLLLVTWGMTGVLAMGELGTRSQSADQKTGNRVAAVGIFAIISLGGATIFALFHTVFLKQALMGDAGARASIITFYYLFVFLVILALTFLVSFLSRYPSKPWRRMSRLGDLGVLVFGITLSIVAGIIILVSNINILRADIFYKHGLRLEKIEHWDGAMLFYNKAIETSRNQDFYYASLARAYLGKGKSSRAQEQETWFRESEKALIKAREISPLNPDHSANLARLYAIWGIAGKEQHRTGLLKKALTHYGVANSLSPANAKIYNEWGKTFLVLGDNDRAREMYQKSLLLDSKYERTYMLLGELYIRQQKWAEAVEAFQQSIQINPWTVHAYIALGYVYMQMRNMEAALQTYQKAVALKPKDFNIRMNLAILYQMVGENAKAISEAENALSLAPEDKKASLQTFLDQLHKLQ